MVALISTRPPTGADALVVLVLLCELAMLRPALTRTQVRLYAAQSLAVSGLALLLGLSTHTGDLDLLAALSLVVKAVAVPLAVLRLLRRYPDELVTSHRLKVATMVLLALVAAAFGFFVVGELPLPARLLPPSALGLAGAEVMVALVLVILRADVVSQAMGFFSLENAVSVATIVLAPGLPLLVEMVVLFDLLVAVVAFGVLIEAHHGRNRTLSTHGLDRLRG